MTIRLDTESLPRKSARAVSIELCNRRPPSIWRRLRIAQVLATSALMRECMRLGPLSALAGRLRKRPGARQAMDLIAGFNRVFPDLASAQEVVSRYRKHGHDTVENANALRDQMVNMRPSDYPVLFHLSRLPLEGLRLFDLGGTMGNIFFLYDRYLDFPASMRWLVHDLPNNMERGRDCARQRGESRLQFTDDLYGASGCDLLLVSGALHYFEFELADYLAGLAERPRHVLVNRTPLVQVPTAATIQYIYEVMVPCRLLNRAELVTGMQRIGYKLADCWRVPELSLRLPYDPDYWVREYSGFYFRAEQEN